MLTVQYLSDMESIKEREHFKGRIRELSSKYQKHATRLRSSCPACGSGEYDFAFKKDSIHYLECTSCSTLFVQNVLDDDHYRDYGEDLCRTVYNSKEYIDYLKNLIEKNYFHVELTIKKIFPKDSKPVIGISGFKNDLLLELLQKKIPSSTLQALDFENPRSKHDMIILSNVIERSLDPRKLINQCHDALKDDGYLYMTARLGNGIDILELWENSRVLPLEHLNLVTIQGVRKLLEEKFEIIELSTPGVLDIQIILSTEPDKLSRFMRHLQKKQNPKTVEEYQQFIQKNLLSSHLVLMARKI